MSEESSSEASEASRTTTDSAVDANNNINMNGAETKTAYEINCQCFMVLDPYPNQQAWRTNPNLQHYCRVCNTQLNSCKQVRIHVGGKKHEKRFNFLKFSIESGAGNPQEELQQYQDSVNLANNFSSQCSMTATNGAGNTTNTNNHSQGQVAGIYYEQEVQVAPVYKPGEAPPGGQPQQQQQPQALYQPTQPAYAYYQTQPVTQGFAQQQGTYYPAPPPPPPAPAQQGEYYPPTPTDLNSPPAYYGYTQPGQYATAPTNPAAYTEYAGYHGETKSVETGSVMSAVSHNSKMNANCNAFIPAAALAAANTTGEHNQAVPPTSEGNATRVPTSPYAYPPPQVGVVPAPPPDLLMCTPAVQQQPPFYHHGQVPPHFAAPKRRDVNGKMVVRPPMNKPPPRTQKRDSTGDAESQGTGDSAHSAGKPGESESGTSSASGEIRCEVCQVSVNSSHQLQAHLAGHKHRQRCFRRGIDPLNSMVTPFSSSSPSRTPSESSCGPVKTRESRGKLGIISVPSTFLRTSLLGHPSLEPIRDIQTSLMGNPPLLANFQPLTIAVAPSVKTKATMANKKVGTSDNDSATLKKKFVQGLAKETAGSGEGVKRSQKSTHGKNGGAGQQGAEERSARKKADELNKESEKMVQSSPLLDMFLQTLEPHNFEHESHEDETNDFSAQMDGVKPEVEAQR